MNIVIDESLKNYIDPLTPDELAALERSLLAEGCRDALVLWGDVLVDGHNRYGLCRKHGLPFQTVQNSRFSTIEDVHLWMIDQHLGRRSVSDFQRGVLALRKREILGGRTAAGQGEPAPAAAAPSVIDGEPAPVATGEPPATGGAEPLRTREAVARAARLSSGQVVMIEKIQKQAAPEVVAAVRAGEISLNAAAAVASLPVEEQVAAASAGKNELKQAAKRARDARRKAPAGESPADPPSGGADDIVVLRQRLAELTAENAALKQELAVLRERLPD